MVEIRNKFYRVLNQELPNLHGKSLYIWGGGAKAGIYVEGFKRHGLIDDICGFVDNDKDKWGRTIQGIPIIGPMQLPEDKNAFVFINTFHEKVNREIEKQLTEKNVEHCILDKYFLCVNKENVIKAFDLLNDDSKELYYALSMSKLYGTEPDVDVTPDQYFPFYPFNAMSNETFLDIGAYRGDTLEKYLTVKGADSFKKYIAFEPDRKNFDVLHKTVDMLVKNGLESSKFCLYNKAIGDKMKRESICIDNKGNGISSIISEDITGNGSCGCELVSLDMFIDEKVDFIKADIESYEYKMILGAKKTIKNNTPMMAICIYHNIWDWFEIPLLINEIEPKYNMAIRHHSRDLTETVLYAWI